MKRFVSCLLLLVIILTMIPVADVQAADFGASGNLGSAKPTKMQIREKWHTVTQASTLYAEEPSVSAPYAPGRLSENLLESGITYLNYIRYVANLPQVQLSAELNENAQYGAVLLAAVDELTHYPSKPADMDDFFYNQGYAATTSSNISLRWGYSLL